jgi:hypothetical protein
MNKSPYFEKWATIIFLAVLFVSCSGVMLKTFNVLETKYSAHIFPHGKKLLHYKNQLLKNISVYKQDIPESDSYW